MIFCFVTALVIIAIISIFFFTGFMENVLTMSVENLFFAHTHSILNDIIQVKKNDFKLSQNELKISQGLISELIQRKNFNYESLASCAKDTDMTESSIKCCTDNQQPSDGCCICRFNDYIENGHKYQYLDEEFLEEGMTLDKI